MRPASRVWLAVLVWWCLPAPLAATCVPDSSSLCLQQERFRVATVWADPYTPRSGVGQAIELTQDTGSFWFFDPGNYEAIIKVLDGRPLGGFFWVFWSSLSTVDWTAAVTDTSTGWVRYYRNPARQQEAGHDLQAFGVTPLGDRLLFVGAHPDDEVLAAPILGAVCREANLACAMLVVTRGERGHCLLPQGCLPDVATVRAEEMTEAAAFYGTSLEMWSLADGHSPDPRVVIGRWAEQVSTDPNPANRRNELVERIRARVDSFAPTAVVTLDPTHGSTGHADHRAIGELVLEAAVGLPASTRVGTLASRFESPQVGFAPPIALDQHFVGFDASLPRIGGSTGWDDLLANAAIHRSQFSPSLLGELSATPESGRVIVLEFHRRTP